MTTPALAAEGLRKTYRGGRTGLDHVDLRVPEGRFFGLIGPNGAGKTTLIGLIASLVRLERGSIRIFGHDVAREPVAAKRRVGLVPQEVNFNSFEPVGEIVAAQAAYYGLSPRRARQRTGQVLATLGLADRARQTAWGLSGGLKRRLMIARALVHQPPLLVLDEPTAGIDVEARHALWELLESLNRAGTTVLLTTHYLEEAERLCNDLAVIDQGCIRARGAPSELVQGLGHQRLVLELASPLDVAPALSVAKVEGWDAGRLEVALPPEAPLNALFTELTALGVSVVGVRPRTNRLEQLLLQMVSDAAPAAEEAP